MPLAGGRARVQARDRRRLPANQVLHQDVEVVGQAQFGGLGPGLHGQDAAGELYVADQNGTIYHVVGPAPSPLQGRTVPGATSGPRGPPVDGVAPA